MKCALTGHRELPADFDVNNVYDTLEKAILDGYDTFYCGMAYGFDLIALDCLVALSRKYPLKLVACIPYAGQERRYSEEFREKYRELLAWCDEKHEFFPHYTAGCYHTRDRFMVDNADMVVAYCKRDKGGTAYTTKYANRMGKEIRLIN